MTETKPGEEIN